MSRITLNQTKSKFILFSLLMMVLSLLSASYSFGQRQNVNYNIVSVESGMKLATAGDQKKGAPVVRKRQVSYGGQWLFLKSAKGVQIYNKKHGLYMAALGQKVQGNPVKLTNTPGAGSYWTILPSRDGRVFQVRNNVNKMYIANMGLLPEKTPIKMTAQPAKGSWWSFIAVN